MQLGVDNVAVVRINGVAGLTGFSYVKIYWPFWPGQKRLSVNAR